MSSKRLESQMCGVVSSRKAAKFLEKVKAMYARDKERAGGRRKRIPRSV